MVGNVRRALIVAAVAAVVVALVVARARRHKPSDEELIRAAVGDMAAKAGERDIGGILEHVSPGYHGEAGSRDDLRGMLMAYLMTRGVVAVFATNVVVMVDGPRATVAFDALMGRVAAPSAGELKPETRIGTEHIEAVFAKEGDRWLVASAQREGGAPRAEP